MLNATDLHVENILPCIEGVRCLDLETLFSAPWIDAPAGQQHWRAHSITSTLLFDGSFFAQSRVGNISGFDPTPTQGSLAKEVNFDIGDDRLEVKQKPTAQKFVTTKHWKIDAAAVMSGFLSATTKRSRDRVRDFVLSLPSDLPLRFVARETFFYAQVLERLRQPRFLRDRKSPGRDLDRLMNSISGNGAVASRLRRLVSLEVKQLLRGDVPHFRCRLDSTEVEASDTTVGFDGFGATPRVHSLSKLHEVEDSDLSEQLALFRIAVGQHSPRSELANDIEPIGLRAILRSFSRRIAEQAFRPRAASPRWLTLRGDVSKSDLRVAVGDRSFFAGDAGIIVALQAAELILPAPDLTELLEMVAVSWKPEVMLVDGKVPVTGFSGLGGGLLAAVWLLRLAPGRWAGLRPWVVERLANLESEVPSQGGGDVVSGAAGLALALAHCSREPGFQQPAAIALRSVRNQIIRTAERDGDGLYWRSLDENRPLLGYAHGWAGIVAALLAGSDQSLNTEVLNESLCWLVTDFRRNGGLVEHRSGENKCKPLNISWCNGAVGFVRGALARGLPECREIEPAVGDFLDRIVSSAGSVDEIRFCCGDMGLIDLLIDLSVATTDQSLCELASAAGESALRRATVKIRGKMREPELEFPGLFQNMSGILYSGCRLLDQSLPSLSGQSATDINGKHSALVDWLSKRSLG